jgi:hypothetical protein
MKAQCIPFPFLGATFAQVFFVMMIVELKWKSSDMFVLRAYVSISPLYVSIF